MGAAQEIATTTTTTTKKTKDKKKKKKLQLFASKNTIKKIRHSIDAEKAFDKIQHLRVPVVVQWVNEPTRNHEDVGSIPGLAQWGKDLALL